MTDDRGAAAADSLGAPQHRLLAALNHDAVSAARHLEPVMLELVLRDVECAR
ncbi:MAG: hypothetical protein JWN04_6912 [Myxococcaceae bacterium]|nr:hypothetical protein [Myxococcaceae bacterium]